MAENRLINNNMLRKFELGGHVRRYSGSERTVMEGVIIGTGSGSTNTEVETGH